MAVAAPKRSSSAAPAPAPSRTSPPRKKAAPARRAPARAPQRARPKTKRSANQPRLALAVGRTAVAVRQLPDTGLIVRMTRGRAWIGVLGVLLVGIVALNVATLSFAASSGKIYEQITALEQDNSVTGGRLAAKESTGRIHNEAAEQGLRMPTEVAPTVLEYSPKDVGIAAQRLAGAE